MKDEVLFCGNWVEVILRDGWYEFSRGVTSAGVVYILPYRSHQEKTILGRFEVCPAHLDEKPRLTTITGGINEKRRPIDVAVEEMHEEAGYKVDYVQLRSLGQVYPTKQASDIGHLYAIDVSDLERGEALGDGSSGEQGAYCDWVTAEQMINCKDPIASCLILRLKSILGIRLY